MKNNSSRQYTNREVSRIIRLALEAKYADTISHRELIDIAQEFGLDETAIQVAIKQEGAELRLARKTQRKKAGFYYHFYSYIGVNILLFIINALTPGPWWFQWSILGWGIGLAFHYKAITQAPKGN